MWASIEGTTGKIRAGESEEEGAHKGGSIWVNMAYTGQGWCEERCKMRLKVTAKRTTQKMD